MQKLKLIGLAVLSLCLLGGCNNRAARSLGHIAPTERRDWSANSIDLAVLTDPALVVQVNCTSVPLLPVYRVDTHGNRTTKSTLKYGVFLMADVSQLERHHYLGLDIPSGVPTPAEELTLTARRAVIYQKLLNIILSNSDEYWRRLFGGMKYAEAIEDGATALTGAGIAATFISPVLGASLTAAGAVSDAFSEELLSGFNAALYKEVQTAMEHEAEIEAARIRGRLTGTYNQYPATELLNDMVDLARMHSVEYGMKALSKANAAREKELEEKKTAANAKAAEEVKAR